jgi:hypothetical protein
MSIVRNIVAGVLSGFGVVVLLQQYAVLYPTGMVTLLGVLIGIAVQFAIAMLADRWRPAAATSAPAAVPVEVPPIAPAAAEPAVEPSADAWAPTHRIPEGGLDAWQDPDPAAAPVARLDAGLEVRLEDTLGGWAHIVCENGWSAWVDGGRLEERA